MARDPQVDGIIETLDDWRGATMAHARELIHDALPEVSEDIKWRKPSNPAGVPCYSQGGLLCTLEHYQDKVKLTFMKGKAIPDPDGLFTGGFGGTRRVIDLQEGDTLDGEAFLRLMQAAAEA